MEKRELMFELARRPLLCDGAMGTQLMARGLRSGECGELWNVDRSADVTAIHRAYREAGCDLLTTNTFGATAIALAKYGLGDRATEINQAGAECAKAAAEGQAFVLGDIGPFGDFLEPMGDMTVEELHRQFSEQATALAAGGVDGFIVETMVDPGELTVAVRAAKSVELPVFATYSFSKTDGVFRTMMGTKPSDAVQAAIDAGADVVGTNCGTALSLAEYVELAGQLVKAAGKTPVIVQPNAGSPQMVNGKATYNATGSHMAELVPQLLQAGVRVIGGCCGTSPAHLQAMRAALSGKMQKM